MTAALLIPGLLCSGEVFEPQRQALAKSLDISIADHCEDESIAGMASSILARAPEIFVLIGHSLGGIIALEIMAQQPARVAASILINTSARADTPEQAARRLGFIGFAEEQGLREAMRKTLPLMLHERHQDDPRLQEVLFRMAEQSGIEVFERQQRALAGRGDYVAQLGAIRCPSLVIVGEADAMTPLDLSQELTAGIPDAKLEIIADCGHVSMLECPEEVTRHIVSFLGERGLIDGGG